MLRTTHQMLALALAAAVLPGCVIYDEDAELRINWEFVGGGNCADVGVSDILVQIDGEGIFEEYGFVSCEARFIDIPADFPSADELEPGDYFITVLGFPPAQGGGATWIAEGFVDLHGGFNEFTFGLEPFF